MGLFAALAGIIFLLYQAWQKDYPPQASAASSKPLLEASPLEAEGLSDAAPSAALASDDEGVPGLGVNPASPSVETSSDATDAETQSATSSSALIEIKTDVYRIEVDLKGGDIHRLELLKYPLEKANPNDPLPLLSDELPHFFVLQSGLVDANGGVPDHKSVYTAERSYYELGPQDKDLVVPLRWTGPDGVSVEKVYRFSRGSYQLDLLYRVNNGSANTRQISPYMRMWRTSTKAGGEPPFVKSFIGSALYTRDSDGKYKYKKHDEKDLTKEPLSVEQQGGWVGMLQHYFVAAVLPPQNEQNRFDLRSGKRFGFVAEYIGEQQDVAAGAGRELDLRMYIGPKMQQKLDTIAPGLELTVDYGLLTPISQPLFWVLNKLHNLTGNWGWSIILLTLMIKLAFYKLSEAQYRSMARMKKFAPRIQSIKERFADDRERLHQAMMDLYKKEGFNPLAGCWPMLVQFPVFIALYWVFLESVEMRQASFMFWLNDLSSPDPYYVLPVLFGISMFLQQKLSGQAMTMEPMQQRIMNIMPIGLAIFFSFFPAGLVLYWLVSNMIGIAQQWFITKRLENDDQTAVKKR